MAVPGPEPAPVSAPVAPDAVERAAAERGLGALVDVRPEVSTAQALTTGCGVAALAVAAMVVLSILVAVPSMFSFAYSVLRFVVLFLLFVAVWGVAFGARGLIVGTRAHYLFEGGLVHVRRSGVRARAWADIEALEGVYDRRTQGKEGRVLGYRVRAGDGGAFEIPLVLVDGRDAFIDHIVAALRALGRPIR